MSATLESSAPRRCPEEGQAINDMCQVSFVSLLANPSKYDGLEILTSGYVHFEFEGNGIYLHKDDYDNSLYKNGLWISLATNVPQKPCQNSYALVIGTFRAGSRGHMGLWSGSIEQATRCFALPRRK